MSEFNEDYNHALMQDVRKVLTADWFYRRQCKWPLLKFDRNTLSFEDKIPVKLCNIKQWSYDLSTYFPILPILLQKYKGKIAVCGGAIARWIYHGREYNGGERVLTKFEWGERDVDIFIYGVSKDEADEILRDCVAILVSNKSVEQQVQVEHREKVTNVIFRASEDHRLNSFCTPIYQFVHRIYPTLNSIIGGFDLGLSMFAYDGDDIYATPLGAWCAQRNMLIIDTTRRSLSYERRIMKYVHTFDCKVVYPGMARFRRSLDDRVSRDEKLSKVERLLQELGLQCNGYHDDEEYKTTRQRLDSILQDAEKGAKLGQLRVYGRYQEIKWALGKPGEREIQRYSDYSTRSVTAEWIPKANANMLRTGNFDGIMTYFLCPDGVEMTYKEARMRFDNIVNEPVVEYDVEHYLDLVNRVGHVWTRHAQVMVFAEFTHCYNGIDIVVGVEELHRVRDILVQRMHVNALEATRRLTGLNWNTSTPQQQWTSSFNPIMKDPRDFYGRYYRSFKIGIPEEIESTLRLMRLRKGNYWNKMPKDIFLLLLKYVVQQHF
jgi:hypothetical protein